jgi:hypothetical protein
VGRVASDAGDERGIGLELRVAAAGRRRGRGLDSPYLPDFSTNLGSLPRFSIDFEFLLLFVH